MTDFVLEQLNEENSRTRPIRSVLNALEGYANFLKQPLKLEMFVPCDEDGNILKEPKRWVESVISAVESKGKSIDINKCLIFVKK